MKIALDATPMTVPSGGVRRYTQELSLALASNFPDDEYRLLSDQPFELPAGAPSNLKAGHGPRNSLERRWWLWGLRNEMARLGIDVFHGTDFSVPYLPVRPSILSLHDLSPWMDPAWHTGANRVRNRTPRLLRLGLASVVLTPCEAVRRQAIERFGLQPGRVVVVPYAASKHFHPVAAPVGSPPYLLYVGTLEPRKNIHLLLEVWREVRRRHPVDLILAGRRRSDFQEISPEPGLQLLGLTAEEELPKLYSGCLACLYPSFYEGFGLPVLEAMQCGAAVITSNDPAIASVSGDAAILLDPREKKGWVQAVESLLTNPQQLQQLQARALTRAKEFSWAKTARLTREVYGHAAERFRKTS